MPEIPEKYLAERSAPSLARYVFYVTAAIAIVIGMVGAVQYHMVNKRTDELQREQIYEEVKVKKQVVEQQIAFLRGVVADLAAMPNVQQHLLLGDVKAARQWAMSVREMLPPSIGVALVSLGGDVLGDPLDLQLGSQCLRDMLVYANGGELPYPPVHAEVPALSHFDLHHPVVDSAGQRIGILFISFSIDFLRATLEGIAHSGGSVSLINVKSGSVVATTGTAPFNRDGWERGSAPVANTDWVVTTRFKLSALHKVLPQMSAVIIGGALFVVIIVVFSVRYMARHFSSEFAHIQQMLEAIEQRKPLAFDDTPHLKETSEIRSRLAPLFSRLHARHRDLHSMSYRDALTGLANRRAFDAELEVIMKDKRELPVCVVILDLDQFKPLNDHYGHAVGDAILKVFAGVLRSQARENDLAARWGGDEFAVILSGMSESQVESWAVRMQGSFTKAQLGLPELDGQEACGVSYGYAAVQRGGEGAARAVLERADEMLYEYKREHRSAS